MNLLGPQGVLSLIDLWLSTAQNRTKGILFGMSEEDIALDAQWPGDPKTFCAGLVNAGFLEKQCLKMQGACDPQCPEQCSPQSYVYRVHDWEHRQPFAFYAQERSNKAREAAITRWSRGKIRRNKGEINTYAPCMPSACGADAKGNAPSPIPSPIKKKNIVAYSDDFEALWKEYPSRNGSKSGKKQAWAEYTRLSPDESLQTLILERIKAQKSHREKVLAKKEFAPEFPDLCRWLRNRRWEDEVREVKPSW